MNRIHLSLRTPDLGAATTFYTQLLGTEPDKIHDDYVRFAPDALPILLSLVPGDAAVDHLGLRLVDRAELQQRLDPLGLSAADEVVCCHAEKSEAWLRDPDGRAWEIYQVTDEAPRAAPTPRSAGCCPSSAADTPR